MLVNSLIFAMLYKNNFLNVIVFTRCYEKYLKLKKLLVFLNIVEVITSFNTDFLWLKNETFLCVFRCFLQKLSNIYLKYQISFYNTCLKFTLK